ncbi:MAG TPA: hypothetical protein GX526_00960, partial [Thermoanaerobacterales bacterium]|nr:hypothetical protein [Thermoanaerobacterales bacterium]
MTDVKFKQMEYNLRKKLTLEENSILQKINNNFDKDDLYIKEKDKKILVYLNKLDLKKLENIIGLQK